MNIYDSAGGCYLRIPAVRALCKSIERSEIDILSMHFVNCDLQKNGNDCGLYAFANAVALCNGLNPAHLVYNQNEMRSHLMKCMEKKEFTVFPGETHISQGFQLNGTIVEKLYCSCKLPEDSELYFECSKCKGWYHTDCEGLGHKTDIQVQKARNLKCLRCQTKKPRKGKK